MKSRFPLMKILLWVALALTLRGGTTASAADDEYARATLKGLKGVAVVIENLGPEVEEAAFSRASIQTDVELKLRLAGIPVLASKGGAALIVNINMVREPQIPLWAYCVNVEVDQSAMLSRDSTIEEPVTTWSVSAVGVVAANRVQNVRNSVKDYVDQFINAYLSVNPK